MEFSYDAIKVDNDNGVTRVTFNRPEKRNAMSPTLHREMYDVLGKLERDDDTRVLVITGEGDAFCAGQDLKQYFYELKDDKAGQEEIRRISHGWRHERLYHFPKPTIAMVNGWCFGGAFTVVGSCDIAIAANEATFGLSEINFGNIPGGLVGRVVADLMVPRQMLYYVLTADTFGGERAAEIGFVTMSVPKSELEAKTQSVAENLLSKDAHALQACKEIFRDVDITKLGYREAWRWLDAKVDQLTYLQGQSSWIEKGVPGFLGKEYRPGLEAKPM